MIKILLTVAVLGSVSSFAGIAIAQSKQDEAFGRNVSSQCAHRRIMPPDPRDGCVRKLRSDAQLGSGQGGGSTSSSSYSQFSGGGAGIGPGNGGGQGNGIGPGSGGGQGKGRR